ncbi:MAG: methylenetetrahydrofolate--tRNA-(uracil(54)-C(5))-methyltransferase (FADH(2)-oxidizing) TrmFO [Deltaproteobacteria bacterium]|nr:MAG: methylenetetrahydrofolate--tRNA-(uracil(54)-C(5))-methyltransferase (FADH(2)-oxidizing) TrmFO [Deltaproteobacteria bacterium]
MQRDVHIVGGGLAGTEAALLLAEAGVRVVLHEQKPERRSPAHKEDGLAELVCSNSLRSDNPENAIGMLHEELRRLGSPVLQQADLARVPAGDALAVDRVKFSGGLTARVREHPGIALSAQLAFYDAIAPIVTGESVDPSVAFAQSRYGKGDGADYLNLPLNREEYERFVEELLRGEKVKPHEFEEARYFEGCLPIEVMAERGRDVLAFGPMKPVGLQDPRTGARPHAVVQLRREDKAGTAWNLVGFQTRLTWPEQKRIFASCIPGLQKAEWVRLGQVHRNTFLNAPLTIDPRGFLKARPHVYCAGQITGVEGYVESAASGHIAARRVLARLHGHEFVPPPPTTAIGALLRHVTGEAHPPDYDYQPTNVVYALFPPLAERHKKNERKARMLARARRDLGAWLGTPPAPEKTWQSPELRS